MKKIIFLIFLINYGSNEASYGQNAQNFTAAFTGATTPTNAIPDNGASYKQFPITVNIGGYNSDVINSTFGLYRVKVNIAHTSKYHLNMRLRAPDGTVRNFILRASMASPPIGKVNYTDTWFRDDAPMTIPTMVASGTTYTHHAAGGFIPEQTINGFNNGQNPNGTWYLELQDVVAATAGTLTSFELEFRDSPGGSKTTSVWTTNSEAAYYAYNLCSSPVKMDKYKNYYGRTRLTYSGDASTDPDIGTTAGKPWRLTSEALNTNSTLDNTIWFSFKTDATGGAVDVFISFIARNAGTGYQAVVLDPGASACVAANWTRVTGTAYMGDNAASSTALSGPTVGNISMYNSVLKCTGLAANKIYYVCIDGNGSGPASDVEFQIEATGAVATIFATLPVELISFNGKKKSNIVSLNWQTLSETNNAYFEIQRSTDGINYNKIERIKGAGTVSTSTSYEYTDKLNSCNAEYIYYKLIQVDHDGKTTEKGIVSVKNNYLEIDNYAFLNNNLELQLYSESSSSLMLRVYDNTGRVIIEKEHRLNKGENFLKEPVNNLSTGIYLISYVDSYGNANTIKLLKDN